MINSVHYKAWLNAIIKLHWLLFGIMLLKLSEDILDRLDIFVLELQELYIPKPRLWEWMWAGSIIFSWTGLKALRKNNVTNMKIYVMMTTIFSLCPVLYCLGYYFSDFWTFVNEKSIDNVSEVWRGTPVSLAWTLFGIIALQIHFFQLYFAYILIQNWSIKRRTE